jgi:hypothetical protein
MVLIPKGKGDLGLPEVWRGISKKSVLGKLLAALLARRLLRFLTNCDLLPPSSMASYLAVLHPLPSPL